MASVADAIARFVDLSVPLDIAVFDQLVAVAYTPGNPQQAEAQAAIMALPEHPDMWQRADQIIEQATNPNAKFLGVIVLSEAIRVRWRVLGGEAGDAARAGIKSFLVKKIIELSSDEATMTANRVFLQKLNLTLVGVLKQEWPHNWPEFISEIVSASASNEILCENNMQILKLLSEEVFEVKDTMTASKTKTLKERLNEEFSQIFQLCDMVLQQSQRPSLLNVTLQTLQRFLTWVPLGYIFETQLIPLLIKKFLPVPVFRNATIECLTEIAGLSECPEQYSPVFVALYTEFLTSLSQLVQPDAGMINAMYEAPGGEHTLKLLALFFSSFFKAHLVLLESPTLAEALNCGICYLVCISELDDPEIFKICLEYWHTFANELYTDETRLSGQGAGGPLALGLGAGGGGRKTMYLDDLLHRLRFCMISKMAKPEEVLIIEDENGDIVREQQKDTEAIAQYKTMREALVFLTHLDYEDTEAIMLEKLATQVEKDSPEWSWHNLNTLCYSIGSISGAMSEDEEKRFLVTVIKDLLGLCEEKRGKDNKAVVASNIMYVVGQYPRFLRAHWKFLKTVVNKLFEFMHEKHPGVQDMACDTFLKIAQKCKRKFVTLQAGETQPFIAHLTEQVPSIIRELENHQIVTFYEAAATMLSERALSTGVGGAAATATADRQKCLMDLLALPNQAWTAVMAQATASGGEALRTPETCRELVRFLKTNNQVCGAVGPLYVTELQVLFGDLMNVYTAYSEFQKAMVDATGPRATTHSDYKLMRSVKKEALRLIGTFVERCGEPEAPPAAVAASLMPLLLQAAPASVLGDYNRSAPEARDPEVLALFSTCIQKLPLATVEGAVPTILEATFECTLQMIVGNYEDFPEFRIQFFTLLKAVNAHAFPALFAIPQAHRKLVVDSVAYAMKHTERNVAETGLDILYELLQNVDRHPQVAQEFYQQFLLVLVQEVLYVMTDRLHKSGIKMHTTLLRHMLHLVEMGKVTVPLFDPAALPPGTTNQAFMRDSIGNLLVSQFSNLSKAQVVAFIACLFDVSLDAAAFKQHVRDFLVQLKEFAGDEDNSSLYDEEAQAQTAGAAADALARRQAVPGILNPYELPDENDEL